MRNSSSDAFEGYPEEWLHKSNWLLYDVLIHFFLGYKELDDYIKVTVILEKLNKYKNAHNKIRQNIKTEDEQKTEQLFLSDREKEFAQELKAIIPLIKKYHHKLGRNLQEALEDRGIRP